MTPDIDPTWQLYLFAAAGCILLWMKMSARNQKIHGLGDILEHAFPTSKRVQVLSQFAIFVGFGSVIAIFAVEPYTNLQALSAGVAWSRLAAKD
jgi:hypothetical protein